MFNQNIKKPQLISIRFESKMKVKFHNFVTMSKYTSIRYKTAEDKTFKISFVYYTFTLQAF